MSGSSLPPTLPERDGSLVSVIVPTYEDDELARRALQSIANQSHSAVEAVIVDSSGVEWLELLGEEADWVQYLYQDPTGLSAARNRGIEAASGEFVGFLDADDEWLPQKLERQVPHLLAGADVVYSDAYVVEGGEERRLSSLPIEDSQSHWLEFLREGGVPISSIVTKRECLLAERFDETLPAVEDRHLLVRLFAEFEPSRVAEPLVRYYRRADTMSSDVEVMYEAELETLGKLNARYPALDDHIDTLRAKADYKHGKRLLRTGRSSDARRSLYHSIRDGYHDPRAIVLLAGSLLPFRGDRVLWHLERIQERLP